jgi:hypothetical protein
MVHLDGRIYDTDQGKWLSMHKDHCCSYRGPVCYWTTNGKTYTLPVARMVYETFVSKDELRKDWIIEFKDGNELNIKPENLKKIKRYEKDSKVIRTFSHDSWLGGDDIYIL